MKKQTSKVTMKTNQLRCFLRGFVSGGCEDGARRDRNEPHGVTVFPCSCKDLELRTRVDKEEVREKEGREGGGVRNGKKEGRTFFLGVSRNRISRDSSLFLHLPQLATHFFLLLPHSSCDFCHSGLVMLKMRGGREREVGKGERGDFDLCFFHPEEQKSILPLLSHHLHLHKDLILECTLATELSDFRWLIRERNRGREFEFFLCVAHLLLNSLKDGFHCFANEEEEEEEEEKEEEVRNR